MMRSLVEWIGDVLLESRIVEQALSRKDFKMKFHHSVDGIIENWGMIKYAEITKQEKYVRCINHWKGELKANVNPLFRMKLKSGSKSSITDEVKNSYFSDHDEARDYVYKTIIDKLDIEGDDDIRYEVVSEVTDEFLNNIYNIFDMIASDDFIGMRKYIESL